MYIYYVFTYTGHLSLLDQTIQYGAQHIKRKLVNSNIILKYTYARTYTILFTRMQWPQQQLVGVARSSHSLAASLSLFTFLSRPIDASFHLAI